MSNEKRKIKKTVKSKEDQVWATYRRILDVLHDGTKDVAIEGNEIFAETAKAYINIKIVPKEDIENIGTGNESPQSTSGDDGEADAVGSNELSDRE